MEIPKTRVLFDRKNVSSKTKKASVIIEVYYQRQRKFFTTGVELFKDQWKKDMVVGRQDSIELMARIKAIKEKIDEYLNERLKNDEEINLEHLRSWVDGHSEGRPASFLVFMQQRMRERPMAEGTFDQHSSVFRTLKKWGKIITFSDITPANILLWDEESKRHSKTGKSIEVWHKVLRIYINEAVTFGYVKKSPYKDFKVKRDRKIKHDFLSPEELKKWRSIVLPSDDIEKARDMFVFCCYTGLSYADMKRFDTRLIYESNGSMRYRRGRKKNDEMFNITILEPAMKVIEKYGGVPMMDDHVYNRYLKDIACLCGISKRISTHCGRVTYASTVMLANGVSLKVLSNAMGHTSVRQTEEYAKLTQLVVDEEFDKLNKIL